MLVEVVEEQLGIALQIACAKPGEDELVQSRACPRMPSTREVGEPMLRAVADGNFDYRIQPPEDRIDEVVELTESFRSMTRQLAELDKLKAEFVSVASHELKTPINVIVGYLQLLEDGIYGPLTQQQLDVHKTVGVQAQALSRLVKQLLDVSRFDAGGGRLEPRAIRLDELQLSPHARTGCGLERDAEICCPCGSGAQQCESCADNEREMSHRRCSMNWETVRSCILQECEIQDLTPQRGSTCD